MKKYLNWNLVVPILFLVGSIFWLMDSVGLQQSDSLGTFMTYTGPGTFPCFILLIMIICSAIVTVQEFLKIKNAPAKESEKIVWMDYIRIAVLLVALLAYILLIPTLGFILPTIVLMFLCMFLFGERNKKMLVLVPILCTLAIFFLFTKVLMVPLPTGPLF